MAWVRLSDDFYEHAKFDQVTALGDSAWARGLAYANRNGTDGFIGHRKALQLANVEGLDVSPQRGIDELLQAGLWDAQEGGYQIHNYTKYQDTLEQIKAKAQANRERVAAFAARKKAAREALLHTPDGNIVQNDAPEIEQSTPDENKPRKDAEQAPDYEETNALINEPLQHTPTPTPTKDLNTLSFSEAEHDTDEPAAVSTAKPSPYSAAFLDFWKVYPRRQAKGDAFKAFEVARKRGLLPDDLVAIVKAYAATREGEDPDFTPLPASWLRAARWDDEAPSAPKSATTEAATAQLDARREAMGKWLAARGSTLDEFDRRKTESGWLDSLKNTPPTNEAP